MISVKNGVLDYKGDCAELMADVGVVVFGIRDAILKNVPEKVQENVVSDYEKIILSVLSVPKGLNDKAAGRAILSALLKTDSL